MRKSQEGKAATFQVRLSVEHGRRTVSKRKNKATQPRRNAHQKKKKTDSGSPQVSGYTFSVSVDQHQRRDKRENVVLQVCVCV